MLKSLLTLAFLLCATSSAHAAAVVLELFTSQGCSSCPAADEVLEDLSHDRDVIALSFHVNYWDYIGWKDPFASEKTTQRQYDYARALDAKGVFTPQLMINGRYSLNGASRRSIEKRIDEINQEKSDVVFMVKDGKVIMPDGAGKAVIEDITYLPSANIEVTRGENAGRFLSSTNIVTSIEVVGLWTGVAQSFVLPKDKTKLKHVILLRDPGTLHILGARRI